MLVLAPVLSLRLQQRAVAVAEEAEVVCEGVVVDFAPIVAYERADEQQQRALLHMEIGDDSLYKMVVVAWGDDYLRGGVEGIGIVAVHPGQNGSEN